MRHLSVLLTFLLLLAACNNAREEGKGNSVREKYLADQEKINAAFSEFYFGNFDSVYALDTQDYLDLMDSRRADFDSLLQSFEKQNPGHYSDFVEKEKKEIKYAFDNFIVMYPYHHSRITGIKKLSDDIIDKRLENNAEELNNPDLLNIESFTSYLESFLYIKSKIELQDPAYSNIDNQQLRATMKLIPVYFTNREIKDYLKHYYLYDYIDRFGIKNIEDIYTDFISTCTDTSLVNSIRSFYEAEKKGREGHLIRTYKTVDGFQLDLHIFLPEGTDRKQQSPVMVYFHGGSWSEGKPDWFFPACGDYAKEGWVAVSVEYRLAYRHGTLPFESVMDARSAIRWLRQHAGEYNIDTNRIVVSGNSAGGHLALCTALVKNWTEAGDDLAISPAPNLILVNSGVYDLTDANNWIRQGLRERGLDEDLVKEISPVYLVREGLPPALIIHGTKDRNVAFSTAETFVNVMEEAGNPVEFRVLEGADHYIWFGEYAQQVSELRRDFLRKYHYE